MWKTLNFQLRKTRIFLSVFRSLILRNNLTFIYLPVLQRVYFTCALNN